MIYFDLQELPNIHPPNPLRNAHGPETHRRSHKHIHPIIIQPIPADFNTAALIALLMSPSRLRPSRRMCDAAAV